MFMGMRWHPPIAGISVCVFVMVIGVIGEQKTHRRTERLFSNSTQLLGRKVTCDNVKPPGGTFPAETWTCYDMRVDGLRIRYWYIPGFGADTGCSDGKNKYDSRNDVGQLCRQMMLAHGIDKELWVAYVNKASCGKSPGKRVIFASRGGTFNWETFFQGNGYIIALRCMAGE